MDMKSVNHKMYRISGILFVAVLMAAMPAAGQNSHARPDIVLIMADDMGFSDIGCYGGEIKTPHLDELAGDGIRFTQFYNGARCCPTRASILTGLYAHQAGMGGMEPDRKLPGYRGNINQQCVTLAEALKHNGYTTYMSGKWHLTNKTRPKNEEDKFNWPCQRGFDYYFGTIAGAGNYFHPATLTRQNENIERQARDDEDFYYTDAISDNAAAYVRAHAREHVDKPMFMYVAYTAPHWPLHAKEADIKKYRGIYDVGWDVIRQRRFQRMRSMGIIDDKWKLSERDPRVPAWNDLENAKLPDKVDECVEDADELRKFMAEKMATYAAMVDCMDQGIGRIIQALKETGRLGNTLLVFLSDNGGCDEWGTYGFGWNNYLKTGQIAGTAESSCSYGPSWAHVSNTPFRYYKLYVHEGGIATPFIVHWPRKIREGRFCRQVGHIIDVMPTFLAAAGGEYPAEYHGNPIKPMEGVSLMPALEGSQIERNPLYWEHIGNHAIRVGNWKLVALGEDGEWKLYNLFDDRTETNNVLRENLPRARAMSLQWWQWAQRSNVLPMNPAKKTRIK